MGAGDARDIPFTTQDRFGRRLPGVVNMPKRENNALRTLAKLGKHHNTDARITVPVPLESSVLVITEKSIHWYNVQCPGIFPCRHSLRTDMVMRAIHQERDVTRLQGTAQAVSTSKTKQASTLYQPTRKIPKAEYNRRCKIPGIPRRAVSSRALRPLHVSQTNTGTPTKSRHITRQIKIGKSSKQASSRRRSGL